MVHRVNGNKLLAKVIEANKKSDRKRISIYISRSAFDELKKLCQIHGIAPSLMIEELVRDFNASVKKS